MLPEEVLRLYQKDPWFVDHLNWLVENKPEVVKRLFPQKKEDLRQFLAQRVKAAVDLFSVQVDKGEDSRKAENLAMEEVVCPPALEEPKEPLSEDLRKRVLEWAESL